MRIRGFNESSQNERVSKMGYYTMANGQMDSLVKGLEELKKSAGNYISFSYEYDPYSNFIKIEVMGDEWEDAISDLIHKNDGYKWDGDEVLTDDGVSMLPMRFY